ncbi:IclR family transcriptional regulator [Ferviditalea candida]|uniref:IclR family transcriptional regulator n=1 Tax=Ferviditalea candida TaxID=3108399 RepID=A0ABU5ZKP6_9BACL|nr:IclR family transcriptional regulator [Paenibacillaceae bacterium T2]
MKSFEKMFNILSMYSMDRTSLSISEIQEELKYPKSTIFRILNTLEKNNYVERNPDNHRYSLGFNFFRLGSIVQSQLDFRKVSLPIMKRLVAETNETVELNIVDGLNRVCIEKVDSPLDVRNFVRIGERKPLHLGASGKVLMAFLDKAEQIRIAENLQKDTGIDKERLLSSLEDIRKQGYACTRGERVPGSFAVAAPLFDKDGQMTASLTIAGPIQRLSDEREKELLQILLKASREISQNLGYPSFS